MRLTDIVSGAGLSVYAIVGLLLFLGAFVAIVWWIFSPGRRKSLEAKKQLPFEEGEPKQNREGEPR